jgi:hypothetical protein
MKLTASIGAFLILALLAVIVGRRTQQMSAMEARAEIVALGDIPDLHLVETKRWEGDAVLGSRIEKKLRDLLQINKREKPCVIEDYHFRDPSGTFTVQLRDLNGESSEISVYGEPSPAIGHLLRTALPDTNFVAKP